ncbi:MAG: hypothetical protein AABZ23_02090 [Deltaproteobacteria bacterium]
MATVFTSWTGLYDAMKDCLADFVATGRFKAVSYTFNGRTVQYRSFDELKKAMDYVRSMADTESGTVTGRTYAKNGGGGRW